jgi:predicted branched-subunit amino acid permease
MTVATLTRRPARGAARDGVVAMAPFVVGYAPFALAVGAVVASHGDRPAGWAGSWLIYGGSAHLATLRTLDRSGLLLAIMTGALINARLLIYSTSLATRWSAQPTWFRLVAAPLIIDSTWALTDAQGDRRGDLAAERRFFLAAGLTLGAGWSALIATGALVGARVGAAHLAVAAPLCLAALVGPHLRHAGTGFVCAVAAVVAAVCRDLPAGTGLLLAVVAGGVTGAAMDGGTS